MSLSTHTHPEFISVASELMSRFPELDLRFNFQNGSNRLRFMVASVSRDIIELDLDTHDADDVLHAAIFEIKERAQIFDD
jgi:hypothetical protein